MVIGYRMTEGCRTSLDKLVREGSLREYHPS